MFVSAYLEAARVLDRPDCREFALKTLDRILAEAWDESKGFLHRVGGPRLEGSLDDQVFAAAALLDAYETTLDRRYFDIAERAMLLAIERYGDPDGGGFFDRAKDAAPMGGLDVRRKPLQDSPTPAGNSVAAIVLDRLHAFTGEKLYREWAEKTLEAFVGLIPQYGLFAATYGLAALLHSRHPMQVVITGAASDPQGRRARKSRARNLSLRKSGPARHAGAIGQGRAPRSSPRNAAAPRRGAAASVRLRRNHLLSAGFGPGQARRTPGRSGGRRQGRRMTRRARPLRAFWPDWGSSANGLPYFRRGKGFDGRQSAMR